MKINTRTLIFILGFLLLSRFNSSASESMVNADGDSETAVFSQSPGIGGSSNTVDNVTGGNIGKDAMKSSGMSHFTWGAELGSSIDLTSHDLSTFDVDVLLGYRNEMIALAGIGSGLHRSIHSGNHFVPLYGIFRTSFTKRPSILFMNLQAGYSFNTISDYGTVGDFSASVGLGINLQRKKSFRTYFVVSLAYQYYSETNEYKIKEIDTNHIFFTRLVFGVNF